MPRPELHSEDAIMDAARAVILERGPRSTTIGAIASTCGAPTGSIYHRFDSIEELLARVWMRAIRRAQSELLDVGVGGRHGGGEVAGPAWHDSEVIAAAIRGALALYDFCLREPADALLLSMFRRSDFDKVRFGAGVNAELEHLNDRIDPFFFALADVLGEPAGMDLALLVLRDLPYGAALSHVRDGSSPPPQRRGLLETAIRAALAAEVESASLA
jgi:AcrR family transcriptional regulator